MRRARPPLGANSIGSSNRRRRSPLKHPLLLGGLALLVFGAVRLYSFHGDLYTLHQQMVGGGGAPATGATQQQQQGELLLELGGGGLGDEEAAGESEDAATWQQLLHNLTTNADKLLAYPHVDECRQCRLCIPQAFVDQVLGNSSSGSSGGGGDLWSLLWPWRRRRSWQEQQQQQWQQQGAEGLRRRRHLLHWAGVGAQSDASSNSGGSSQAVLEQPRQGIKQQQRLPLQPQQQQRPGLLLHAPVVAAAASSSIRMFGGLLLHSLAGLQRWLGSAVLRLGSLQGDSHQQQQQRSQQQRQRRRLQASDDQDIPLPPGHRPPLDGVKTHKAWLAKQAAGTANNNTHAVPGVEVILSMPDNSFSWAGATYHIGPGSLQMDERKIRMCDVCRGCRQQLRHMPKGIKWLGSSFTHDPGASAGWMAMADTPEAPPRPAAVKVWCVPVPKPGTRVPAVCKPKEIREQLQLLLALQNIAHDCRLDELLPRHWVGPVDGVLPGSGGYRVLWDGLWADLAVGVSAENLVHGGEPRLAPQAVLDVLQTRLNHTQVVMAAVFDLLFSQCDRHGQNLYLKPDGSLVLIDNDQAFGASWRPCGVDSLFLPGTQKFEVARLGFSYVLKKPEYAPPKVPRRDLDPLQLLDYRCHAPGGKLGTTFPRPVSRCLKRLARSSPEQIAASYGYPNELMAAAVHQRAKDLLSKGFEWTLKYGWPQNPEAVRYKWAKGCCKMQPRRSGAGSSSSSSSSDGGGAAAGGDQGGQYECSSWVQPELGWPEDLPAGDPVAVMEWAHNGVDSGSYNLTDEYADVAWDWPF